MKRWLGMTVVLAGITSAQAQGVPIQVTQDAFACRDLSDIIRLGLRQAEGDKAGFIASYSAKQATGDCVALRNGTVGALDDVRDEQKLHMACIKRQGDAACLWVLHPRFGPAPC